MQTQYQTDLSQQAREVKVSQESHRGQLIEASEQFIQRHDQLLSRALGCQAGESLDVCKQNAAERGRITETTEQLKRNLRTTPPSTTEEE